MMLGRFEIPVTKTARHMEKATFDELNRPQNAGICPIKYQQGRIVGVSVHEAQQPQPDSDSPRSTLRTCLNQADLLAKGSFRIGAYSSNPKQEPQSGTGTRVAGCGVSAGHVVLTDDLLDFDRIVGIQRRSLSAWDMEDVRDAPETPGRLELRYSSVMRQGLEKIQKQPSYEERRACDLMDASIPNMLDPLSNRVYGAALQRALNPDLVALHITEKIDTASPAPPSPIQIVPASLIGYLSGLSDEDLRRTIVLGAAGYPSTASITDVKKVEVIHAYPEALLRLANRSGMTTEALSQLVKNVEQIFTDAKGDQHVLSVGRLLGCSDTLIAHTANGLPRFSGAGLGVLNPKAANGAIYAVHIAPGEGITGEYNLAVPLDALAPSVMVIGDVLPTEDRPSDLRWTTELGKDQKRTLIKYLGVTIPPILGASEHLRKLAFSESKKGRRNLWIQALVEETRSTYRNASFRGDFCLLSEDARSKAVEEAVWNAIKDYIPLSKEDFLDVTEQDCATEGPMLLMQRLNQTFDELGPLSLAFLNFPPEIVAVDWRSLFGTFEMLVRKWDGPSRFESLKKDWTPESLKQIQLGIYEMDNALWSRAIRQKKAAEDIQKLKSKLRELGLSDEKILTVLDDVEPDDKPIQWTNWDNVERLRAYKGASQMVTAAGSQLLTAKDTEADLVPAPSGYSFGPDGCPIKQDVPRQRARTLYQIGLNKLAEVLRADFTPYELRAPLEEPLERHSFLVDVTESPVHPLDYAEMYRQILEHNKAGYTVSAISDLYDTFNYGKPQPDPEGNRLKVLQVEVHQEAIKGVAASIDEFLVDLSSDPFLGFVSSGRLKKSGGPPSI